MKKKKKKKKKDIRYYCYYYYYSQTKLSLVQWINFEFSPSVVQSVIANFVPDDMIHHSFLAWDEMFTFYRF